MARATRTRQLLTCQTTIPDNDRNSSEKHKKKNPEKQRNIGKDYSSESLSGEEENVSNKINKHILIDKVSEILEKEEQKLDNEAKKKSKKDDKQRNITPSRSPTRDVMDKITEILEKEENKMDEKNKKCKKEHKEKRHSTSMLPQQHVMDKITEILEEEESKIVVKKNETDRKKHSRSRSSSRSRKKQKKTRSKSNSEERIKRSRSRSTKKRYSRNKTRSRSRSRSYSRHSRSRRNRSRSHRKSRSRSRSRRSRSRSRRKSRSRSRSRHSRSRSRRKSRSRSRSRRSRSRSHRENHSRSRSKSRKRSRSRHRKSRSRSRDRRKIRSRSRSPSIEDNKQDSKNKSLWDIKTMVETTRILENESTPANKQDKDSIFQRISALKRSTNIEIKYGNGMSGVKLINDINSFSQQRRQQEKASFYGKWETVSSSSAAHDAKENSQNSELQTFTELCQKISAKEKFYENQSDDEVNTPAANDNSEEDKYGCASSIYHHPFSVKPAPVMSLDFGKRFKTPMNPAQAIMAGSINSLTANPADVITGPLEKYFPVSTGTDHRERENMIGKDADLPVYEESVRKEEQINVSAVIARRLGAQQILNGNPNDVMAKKVLDECDRKLKGWSERNKKPGKFTGERGVRMDKKEMAGAIETWVRKDFFHNLAPVVGGIGMRMMQNMGWKQGTPLGKNREGYVAPITFDVKVDRSGLSTSDERPQKCGMSSLPKKRLSANTLNIDGKHPVSALAEMCTKRKMGTPEYSVVFESGQSHSKNFLMKVTVMNVDYQPSVASPNKKHAKAQAAFTALKILGYQRLNEGEIVID